MTAHRHDNLLPRAPLMLASGMALLALAFVGTVRLAGVPPSASPAALRIADGAAPTAHRDLRFTDRRDGSVLIEDIASGKVAGTVAAGSKSGFIRGVMRGLARDRHKRGLGDAQPFRLTAWSDGELSLVDPTNGRAIELSAFGATNRAAFAALLAGAPASSGAPR